MSSSLVFSKSLCHRNSPFRHEKKTKEKKMFLRHAEVYVPNSEQVSGAGRLVEEKRGEQKPGLRDGEKKKKIFSESSRGIYSLLQHKKPNELMARKGTHLKTRDPSYQQTGI